MNKELWDFTGCMHFLWVTYVARRYGAVEVYTEGVQKLGWWQNGHRAVMHCHVDRFKSYT